jgi:hypothetical protein
VGIRLIGHRLSARVDDDDMTLFEVLDQSVEILEVEPAAGVIAALWGNGDRSLSNENGRSGVKILTSSSSRSMAESAFIMEPLSDSMEEDIFPASRRSVWLRKSKEKGGEMGQQGRGVNEESIGRTLEG